LAVISVEQTKVSVRPSASVEQLTRLATVFLLSRSSPAFFGQNFGRPVAHADSVWDFVIFGIGCLLLPCVILLERIRRCGPLASGRRVRQPSLRPCTAPRAGHPTVGPREVGGQS
jgi:hypothetical protein